MNRELDTLYPNKGVLDMPRMGIWGIDCFLFIQNKGGYLGSVKIDVLMVGFGTIDADTPWAIVCRSVSALPESTPNVDFIIAFVEELRLRYAFFLWV